MNRPLPTDVGAPAPTGPPARTIAALILLDTMLMVFSIILWKVGNDALAATAGAGAIALTADLARRLLTPAHLSAPSASGADEQRSGPGQTS